MGKDTVREKDIAAMAGSSRRSGRPVSASPYSENYRPPIDLCQRHLINHRLMVSKLTRRELEDKYLSLCDENYTIKKRFLEQEEQIKRLKTKLTRLSNESNNRSKSRLDMASSEHYRLHDLELQRRELHEKLEALRRATSIEGQRMQSVTKGNSTARTSAVNQRRSKSARPAKDADAGRRECKSSSPSNDGYDEEDDRHHRPVGRPSTDDRTEDDDDDSADRAVHRNNHRKSYGADDEDEDDDEEHGVVAGVDEDRDVLSGDSDDLNQSERESGRVEGKGGIVGVPSTKMIAKDRRHGTAKSKARQVQCPDCERHRTEQLTRETDLVKMKLNIKYLHKELQNEKEKSTLLARQLEEKLSYEIMKRNATENLEILNLNRQVEDLAKELQRQVDEQKRSMEHEMRKQGDLEAQIRKEKDKNASLFEECERLKKNIEKLKENMSEVEIERDFLKRQQENFTKIVDENKLLKYQLDELRKHNEELLRQIDTLKEEELVTKESQRELLEKLKTLQQDNDTLSVMLEGLRTENELLAEERTQLEHSLKSLEASPIKEVRPVSPTRPSMSVSVQTEHYQAENGTPISETFEPGKVFLKEPSPVERSVKTMHEREPFTLAPTPLSRRSSVAARMSRERHAYEAADAAQQLFRQVSVSQMIPKLSQIMNNRTDEPPKPNNVELLIANSYPETLEKSLRENEQFYTLQSAARRGNTDRGSITSSVSEKKRISFRDAASLSEPRLKDGDHSVQENYARFFNIQRIPSMWHKIAENPLPTTSSIPNQIFKIKRSSDDMLTIEIRSVRWNESAVERLLEAKVSLYYVEFTFLDLYGHRLETPHSASFITNQGEVRLEHTFNFRVNIELDTKHHAERREELKKMLLPDGNDAVRFVVVNENRSTDFDVGHSSEDIGYSSIKLRNELRKASTQNESELFVEAPIYDFGHEHAELGILTIKFDNIKLLLPLMPNGSL
ncbi:kinesin-related protein 4-like isoform X2 [Anopheles funestus]|uniref:kinesin-related protein 4-like isoform X2 n=1 Tax=Anopheles funestus TaxID=62324 RepID=UPI0020C6FFB3|nr:kinesin-related protein 4-like isoform X2 [Anopheles funestus]